MQVSLFIHTTLLVEFIFFLQNIQNAAGISAHFPVHHTDVTESLYASYNNLPLHLPEQARAAHARRSCDITSMPLKWGHTRRQIKKTEIQKARKVRLTEPFRMLGDASFLKKFTAQFYLRG
jgi:hypothetical protein